MESLEIKPSKSVAEQISLLRDKNMMVDEAEAHQWLQNVGYYRLSGYWYPCRTLEDATTKPPRRSDDFTDGTRFSDVVHLYETDREMRSLIHDGLERVEIGMRARVGTLLAARDRSATSIRTLSGQLLTTSTGWGRQPIGSREHGVAASR